MTKKTFSRIALLTLAAVLAFAPVTLAGTPSAGDEASVACKPNHPLGSGMSSARSKLDINGVR